MENNESLYFNCTACGKCCTSPPSFTSKEFLKYYDKFPFSIFFLNTIISSEQKKQIEDYFIVKPVPSKSNLFFYSLIDFRPLFTENLSCPYLKNNLCSLQDDKPTKCKTVPFISLYDESTQYKAFQEWHVKNNSFYGFGCLSDEPKEGLIKIYDKKEILDNNYKSNFHLLEKQYKEQKEDLINFLNGDFPYNYQFNYPSAVYFINPSFYLQFLLTSNKITKEELINFIDLQKTLLNNLIEKNIQMKNKKDKQTTHYARQFLYENETLKNLLLEYINKENNEN